MPEPFFLMGVGKDASGCQEACWGLLKKGYIIFSSDRGHLGSTTRALKRMPRDIRHTETR
jgi:hypothetical protein